MTVRVRYAPSPTGYQHIGGVRTALFNYLFARANQGVFVLRIEDTDRTRFSEGALQDIYDTFDWLGFRWDEGPDVGGASGPYFQSARLDVYNTYISSLVEHGYAYPCFCTRERLDEVRKTHQGYDRHCSKLSVEQRAESASACSRPVIRFRVPLEGTTSFRDQLIGEIETPNRDISADPILLKSDGYPTYHLANVVDDHTMKITHIMRAHEWLPSCPLHVLIYRALGWEPPEYCHLPMVMGADGKKLSKRHGATSLRDLRAQGYLPEAIVNQVALLGWSFDGVQELFHIDDLRKLFRAERLNKAPAVFDYRKLDWFNGVYIREKSHEELRDLTMPYLQKAGLVADPPTSREQEVTLGAMPLVRERLQRLADAPDLMRFLFLEPAGFAVGELVPKKFDLGKTLTVLDSVVELLETYDSFPDEQNEERFRACAKRIGVKLGDMLMPLRVAVTGSRVSLPMFESIRLLGAGEARRRVGLASDMIKVEKE